MERQEWLALGTRSMAVTFDAFARSAGAEVIERDGVFAILNPAVPERSVFNSVVYSDPAGFAAVRAELAAAYAERGCAWTVWVPGDDTGTAGLLAAAGHRLDAEPRAMGAPLSAFAEPDLEGIEWTGAGEIEAAGALNDAAYGYPPGTWLRGIGRSPDGLRTYIAHLDGEPVSTVAVRYADGDCPIWNVATSERARGRGLATRLMAKALADARVAGCETTTLQATKLGAPVYRRLGYEDFGSLQMWEHRDEDEPGGR